MDHLSTSSPSSCEQKDNKPTQLSGDKFDPGQSSVISRVILECIDSSKQNDPSNSTNVQAFDQIPIGKVSDLGEAYASNALLSRSPRNQNHKCRSFEKEEVQAQSNPSFPYLPRVPVEPGISVGKSDESHVKKTPTLTVIINGEILVKPFPLLVHEMLSQADPTLMKWTDDGSAFKIYSRCETQPRKVNSMLTNFSLPKFCAFKKELYSFGWNEQQGHRTKTFYHPDFHKDADFSDIARIKKNRTVRKRSDHNSAVRSDPEMHLKPIFNSVKKRGVMTARVPSPISLEFAPSKRAKLIPISPIEFSSEVYCEIDKADKITKIVNSDFNSNFANFIYVKDEDNNSDVSVPLTPLSINIQEAFNMFTEGMI